MPLDSNGIHQYVEADMGATFSDLLNLLAASTSDAVEDDRARLAALEQPAPGFTVLPLGAGWAPQAGWPALGYRLLDGQVQLSATLLQRTGSVQPTSPGAGFAVATLPTGYRPTSIQGAAGTLGVAGSLGASLVQIGTNGGVNVVSMVGGGDIAVGGGYGNHVFVPAMGFPL